MRIVIIGPGRLGRSLARLLPGAGHSVRLCGRGDRVPARGVVLLAVPDAAIEHVAGQLDAREEPVLHCSGATGVEILRPHRPAGSWHPLMTFPGPEQGLPELEGVAAAVDGDPPARAVGRAIALSLGMRPVHVPGDRRLYHLAAVMAGNFSTVLLGCGVEALEAAGVPAKDAAAMLAPLALRSVQNAVPDPAAALTGPAARRDHAVAEAHRQALEEAGLEDVERVYRVLHRAALRLAASRAPS